MPDKDAPSTAPEESQVAVTPDEEVAARAEELDELRAMIQSERDERQRKEAGLSHELRIADLDVEKARLIAELAAEKQLTAKVDGSADNSFENAEAAMRHAVAQSQQTDALQKAEAKARADAAPNPLLEDSPVPDGAAPSVAARSVAPEAPVVKATTTGKAAK